MDAIESEEKPKEVEASAKDGSKNPNRLAVLTAILSSSLLVAVIGAAIAHFSGYKLEYTKVALALKKDERKHLTDKYENLLHSLDDFESAMENIIGAFKGALAGEANNTAYTKHVDESVDKLGRAMGEVYKFINDVEIDEAIRTQITALSEASGRGIFAAQNKNKNNDYKQGRLALSNLYETKLKHDFQDIKEKIRDKKSKLLTEPL